MSSFSDPGWPSLRRQRGKVSHSRCAPVSCPFHTIDTVRYFGKLEGWIHFNNILFSPIFRLIETLQSHKNSSTYDPLAMLKKNVKKFPDDEEPTPSTVPETPAGETITLEEFDKQRLQTILLSATLTQGVQKLAGLTLTEAQHIDASNDSNQPQDSTIPIKATDLVNTEDQLSIPDSVFQSYVVMPPKLRLVTLSSYIIAKANKNCKILVFMATQDMIDFHTELLNAVLVKGDNDRDLGDEEEKEVGDSDGENSVKIEDSDDEEVHGLVNVQIFKLHGSMSQQERTEVFKTFRGVKIGVLFCTVSFITRE